MDLHLQADQAFAAPPDAVFALALDAARFPEFFSGYGPIPAVRQITLHAPSAVGSTRALLNSDGSQLHERITAYAPPHHHAYTLTGLRAPLAWLVRAGHADWRFVPAGDGTPGNGTHVTWRYRWTLTSPLAWPLAAPLLRVFMRGAMARCLASMAAALDAAPRTATGHSVTDDTHLDSMHLDSMHLDGTHLDGTHPDGTHPDSSPPDSTHPRTEL